MKLTKEFTNDELWFNVSAFRLYVWILLKAAYRDGLIVGGVELKKGQYIQAYSELGKDLMYIEGRSKKVLAKSTVKRAVDKLVKRGFLEAEETPLGTKFTIVHFDQFKCLEGSSDFFCPPNRETETEPRQSNRETDLEQYNRIEEFKQEKNKEINRDRVLPFSFLENRPEPFSLEDQQDRIEAVTARFLQLRNRGPSLTVKDKAAVRLICTIPEQTEKLLLLMEEAFTDYKQKNPNDTIQSATIAQWPFNQVKSEKAPKRKRGKRQLREEDFDLKD